MPELKMSDIFTEAQKSSADVPKLITDLTKIYNGVCQSIIACVSLPLSIIASC